MKSTFKLLSIMVLMFTSMLSISDSSDSEPECTSEEMKLINIYMEHMAQAVVDDNWQRLDSLKQEILKQITPSCLNSFTLSKRYDKRSYGAPGGNCYPGLDCPEIIGTESTGPRAIETPEKTVNEN